MEDLFTQVQEIIVLTFGVKPARVTPETVREDISEWDSVGHLNLMMALEAAFELSLDIEDIARMTSVPTIMGFISKR